MTAITSLFHPDDNPSEPPYDYPYSNRCGTCGERAVKDAICGNCGCDYHAKTCPECGCCYGKGWDEKGGCPACQGIVPKPIGRKREQREIGGGRAMGKVTRLTGKLRDLLTTLSLYGPGLDGEEITIVIVDREKRNLIERVRARAEELAPRWGDAGGFDRGTQSGIDATIQAMIEIASERKEENELD